MQGLVELEPGPTGREGLTIYMQLIIKGCQMSEWELVILWLNAHHMSNLSCAHDLQHQFKLNPYYCLVTHSCAPTPHRAAGGGFACQLVPDNDCKPCAFLFLGTGGAKVIVIVF